MYVEDWKGAVFSNIVQFMATVSSTSRQFALTTYVKCCPDLRNRCVVAKRITGVLHGSGYRLGKTQHFPID